jgi:exopolysaccharide production protein ExoY
MLKRAMDVVVAALTLLLTSPLILVTAIAIKSHDGGPILYRRRCVGVGGKEFDAYKFRSMRVDADQVLQRDAQLRKEFEENFKLSRDPRVTSVGRLIRKTSIDELPQFWNVLLGNMSAVGPRMITRAELAKYRDCADILLSVKPGVTGYWQTEGRQKKSYEERVEMDMYYIQNWSLWFDVRMLLRTPFKVVKGDGAY